MTYSISREHFGTIWHLAYPVVLGMMARTIMGVVDTAMVGRLGAEQLAATGLGVHIVLMFVYSMGRFNVGVQAISARRFGEGRFHDCGELINRSISTILVIGVVASFMGYFLGPVVLSFLTSNEKVFEFGSSYVSIRLLEAFPFFLISLYRGFFDGIGNTKVYMRAMIFMNTLNIGFNYVLIFGHFGAPQMGVTGAALGSMISSYLGVFLMVTPALKKSVVHKYNLYKNMRPDIPLITNLFRVSAPSMIQVVVALAGFLVFMAITGLISIEALAISNVCITIMSASFMPGFGIGTAAATLMGQNLGASKPEMAGQYAVESVKLGMVFMGVIGVFFMVIPEQILSLFTQEATLIEQGRIVLMLMGVVQSVDAVGMIFGSSLQGAGMTKQVMIIESVCVWLLFIPLSYIFGIYFGYGLIGAWFGLFMYLVSYAVAMTIAFKKGTWKLVKV